MIQRLSRVDSFTWEVMKNFGTTLLNEAKMVCEKELKSKTNQ